MNKTALDYAGFVVGIFALTTWGFCAWSRVFMEIPQANMAGFSDIQSQSGAMTLLIVGYFFGSSAGSKRNGETVRNIAEKSKP